MKIIEAQSATLTNYEVYTHLLDQQARYKARHRMGPGNLNTLVKEVVFQDPDSFTTNANSSISPQLMIDFHAPPSPLGNKPLPYNSSSIRTLIERLRPYDLAKAEMLMILNHRPTHISHLSFLLEEVGERFPEMETQWEIVNIVAEVLGAPDGEAERSAMEKNAKDARERQAEAGAKEAAREIQDERAT